MKLPLTTSHSWLAEVRTYFLKVMTRSLHTCKQEIETLQKVCMHDISHLNHVNV